MTNEITQTGRYGNKEIDFVLHIFQDKCAIMSVTTGATLINIHLSSVDLYALGDAIQRIVAGEDRYSESKDDQS